MRVLLVILAVAATPAAAVVLWTRSHPAPLPAPPGQARSVVWADRVFTTEGELRRWLRGRGQRYAVWARKHPLDAATLEHRRLPEKGSTAQTATPAHEYGSGRTLAELLAALLVATGTAMIVRRSRWRVPLRGVRARRPRIALPAMSIDVRPLADSLGQLVDRFPRVRLPERPRAAVGPVYGAGESRDVVAVAATRNGHHRIVDRPQPVVANGTIVVEDVPPLEAAPLEAPPVEAPPLEPPAPVPVEPEAAAQPVEALAPPPAEAPAPPVEPPAPPVEAAATAPVEPVLPPPPVEPPAPAPAPAQPLLPVTEPQPAVADGNWEFCATACWRGYVTAKLYAHRRGDDRSIAQSTPFEWWAWHEAPRNPEAAEAALGDLCARLKAEGWEAFARGEAPYEVRLRRRPAARAVSVRA